MLQKPLFFLVFLVFPFFSNAQYATNRSALSLRYHTLNYQFQFDQIWYGQDFADGIQLEYTLFLKDRLVLGIPLNLTGARYPIESNRNAFLKNNYIGLDAILHYQLVNGKSRIVPSLYSGIGTNVENFNAFNINIPIGGNIDFKLLPRVYFSGRMEYRIGFKEFRKAISPGLGLKYLLNKEEYIPPPDRDGDGVIDKEDLCPNEAGKKELSGCPDQDNDGLVDAKDDCPQLFGPIENKGCPDKDGDGVVDPQDKCPDEKGKAALDGCPDSDGDGLPDIEDNCPDEIGSKATNGCPDSDYDGIANIEDACPYQEGPKSNNGCPELEEETLSILEYAAQAIQFETGSAKLTQASFSILDQVLKVVQTHPDYQLSIEGHTDNVGTEKNNQELSEKRAKACFDYLLQQGLPSNRIQFKGFGQSRPIADNKDAAGREQNRRVAFRLRKE